MSRSPKYSFAQLDKKVRDQVQHDRDARHLRREDAEARIRDRELAEGRTEIVQRYRTVAATLSALGPQAQDVGAGVVAVALDGALQHVREADSFTDLAAAGSELDRAERSARRLRIRTAAKPERTNTDRITVLAEMLREAAAERARYDPGDAAALDFRVARLQKMPNPGANDVDTLAAGVLEHLDRVAASRSEHHDQRRRAVARVELLAVRLEDLRADGMAAHVPLRDGDRAREALAMLRSQLACGELADVLRLGTALERRVDAIEADLDGVIDQIAERRAVLTSLVRALPAVGFSVDAESVTESKDGAIGLRAYRPDGDTIAMIVEGETEADDSHLVLYASDAVQREEQLGRTDTACGDLLEIIDVIQESAGRNGVIMSPVTWVGRDGRRPPPQNASRRMAPPAADASRAQENPTWRP
jgi:hypothetical protein